MIVTEDTVIALPPRCGTMSAKAAYDGAIQTPFEHMMAWPMDGRRRIMLVRNPAERLLSLWRYNRQRKGYKELSSVAHTDAYWDVFFTTESYPYWTANLSEWARKFKPDELVHVSALTGVHRNASQPEPLVLPNDPRILAWVNEDLELLNAWT